MPATLRQVLRFTVYYAAVSARHCFSAYLPCYAIDAAVDAAADISLDA